MINEKLYSYSSANTFPMKILLNPEIINCIIQHGRIPSVHYQLNPTNKCNFNCPMCSCSERDKQLEIDMDSIYQYLNVALLKGIKSVTITGGGEPLLHPNINDIIECHLDCNIKVGLVTNGTLLHKTNKLNDITWCRISASDYLKEQLKRVNETPKSWLRELVDYSYNSVDFSFSYVLTDKPNYHLIKMLLQFAKEYSFTHFRLVNDIFEADKLTRQMYNVMKYLEKNEIDDSIVNYQDRSEWTKGFNPCYLSLLKPVIGADKGIYPCCGTQYALDNPSRDYEKLMKMGTIDNLKHILSNNLYFDGSICQKCYYSQYNEVLNIIFNGLRHKEFI